MHWPNAGWGLGWSVGKPYKGRVYGELLPAPNYFNHGGYGGVEMWMDPTNEIVGVYFSVALETDERDFSIQDADLFMNMVTAAVVDGATSRSTPMGNSRIRGDQSEIKLASSKPGATIASSQPRRLRSGSPEEVGVHPQRLKKVIELAQDWVERDLHSAISIVAARHGVVFLNEAFGRMGPEKNAAPLPPDAIFPLASLTKPITATAVMILVEEGVLGLNRPVQDYIPEFQGEGKELITIRHLMTHTSGLRAEDLLELAKERGITPDSEWSESNWVYLFDSFDQYLDLINEVEPSISPDKRMYYCICNHDLLGDVIERVSGRKYSEFVRQRILEPLGMKNTFLPVPRNLQKQVVRRPETAPFYYFLSAFLESGIPSGGGGYFGTGMDQAIFGQMFLNGGTYGSARILSQSSVAAMTRDEIPGIEAFEGDESIGAAEWGLGWSIHNTGKNVSYDEPLLSTGSYCHGGAGGVFIWVDPARDLVAVFFSTYLSETEAGQPVAATDLYINSLLAAIVD
jgi:CubicO group peptidase (beta-lactamase class C family)